MPAVDFPPCLPFSIGQADDTTPVGDSLRCVHQTGAPLVLQLCDLAQRLHRGNQPMQDAATLGVLAWVRRPHGCQSGHELPREEEKIACRIVTKACGNVWLLMLVRNTALLQNVAYWSC